MITQEKDVEIRILARQGKGIREISRIMGISRNTVRRYLRCAAWPGYKRRIGKPGKLDPFKRYLEERVEAAKPHLLPAPVLYREIWRTGIRRLRAARTQLSAYPEARTGASDRAAFRDRPRTADAD